MVLGKYLEWEVLGDNLPKEGCMGEASGGILFFRAGLGRFPC